MSTQWFILVDDLITGPHNARFVDAEVRAGRIDAQALIWGKGHKEWVSISKWDTLKASTPEANPEFAGNFWYYELSGKVLGPYPKEDLVRHLSMLGNKSIIRVWSSLQNQWLSLFACEELCLELKLPFRKFSRVPISGTVQLPVRGVMQEFPLSHISQGGFGITNAQNLEASDLATVRTVLTSPLLPQPVRAGAAFLYRFASGYAGFRFADIGMEALTLVVTYIKQVESQARKTEAGEWHAEFRDQKYGPLSLDQMARLIRELDQSQQTEIVIWRPGMQRWAQFNEIPELVDLIAQRRKSDRAPLVGTLTRTDCIPNQKFSVISVSKSGLSFHGSQDMLVGDKMSFKLESRLLAGPVLLDGSIVHIETNNEVGLKFELVDPAGRKFIESYLENFQSAAPQTLIRKPA